MSVRRELVYLIILLGLFGLLASVVNAPSGRSVRSSDSISERERTEVARIERLGGSQAYAALAEEINSYPTQLQHTAAHAFGAALYKVEGKEGLSVCDAQFSYGCFHEFLGRAIADLGIHSVLELNKRCFENLGANGLSCQHGIGHGVQAYYGYETKHLFEALDSCASLPGSDPIGGCFGGAFMEYNFQTMLGEQGAVRKNSGEIYFPCSAVEDKFKPACFFWQPQWWAISFKNDFNTKEEIFERMGALCSSVESAYRRACFEGIGNITAEAASFSGERSRALCERSAQSGSKEALYCLSIAANSIGLSSEGGHSEARSACGSLIKHQKDFCEAYAENRANILMVREPVEDL